MHESMDLKAVVPVSIAPCKPALTLKNLSCSTTDNYTKDGGPGASDFYVVFTFEDNW